MSSNVVASGGYKNVTATGNIYHRPCDVLGFYVNSTTAGTIILYDDASTGTSLPISGTITPAIGWNPYPVSTKSGLGVVTGGTLNVTIVFV